MRVLVVSDVRIVQEGLRLLLAQHEAIEIVSAADSVHARDQSERLHPDVVLFDATRADAERAHAFVAEMPGSRVVAFGVNEQGEQILALAAAGTAGYVRDSAASADVVGVLERVMRDELPCSARAAASLYREVAKLSCGTRERSLQDAPARLLEERNSAIARTGLSRRELQIAHLIDCGLSNKEIARRLGIEAVTVKNHVHNLCEKLNVHRRGAALARLRALLRAQILPDPAAPEASSAPAAWFQ